MKTLLHVGCGSSRIDSTTQGFYFGNWRELRFDMNPDVKPDFVGSMLDMSVIQNSAVDAVYCSHSIEHLYFHEVPKALQEFKRVLSPAGFVVLTCPDLQSVCALVAQDQLLEPAYQSPAGPISPIDILYGFRKAIERGNTGMAHRTGFTARSLTNVLLDAGFGKVSIMCRDFFPHFDLWAIATISECSEAEMKVLTSQHFPR